MTCHANYEWNGLTDSTWKATNTKREKSVIALDLERQTLQTQLPSAISMGQ